MKKYFQINTLLASFLLLVLAVNAQTTTIHIDMRSFITPQKKVFQQGETIRVSFTNFPGFKQDWIGIYKEWDFNNKNYKDWKYTDGKQNGTVEFQVPAEPGRYELRGFANNGYEKFVTSEVITVRAASLTQYNTDWRGTWKTTNFPSELTISQSGNAIWGTYTYLGGQIVGIANGNIITGTWKENNNDNGRFMFEMSADGKSFKGKWNYGNDELTQVWDATKIITSNPLPKKPNTTSTTQPNNNQPTSESLDGKSSLTTSKKIYTKTDIVVFHYKYAGDWESTWLVVTPLTSGGDGMTTAADLYGNPATREFVNRFSPAKYKAELFANYENGSFQKLLATCTFEITK